MREIPLDESPEDVTGAGHDAAHASAVDLTERGQWPAAMVPIASLDLTPSTRW